jgi:hypothetical protein
MQHSSGKYPYKAYSATLDLLPIGCSARNYFTEIIYAKHLNIKILKLGHCPNALLGLPGAYRASADDLLMNYSAMLWQIMHARKIKMHLWAPRPQSI